MSLGEKIKKVFSADLRSLAVMRICIALLIIIDLIFRVPDIKAFYTDEGVMPRLLLISLTMASSAVSIHNLNGSLQFEQVLFLISGVFAFLLLFGYKTRLVTFLSWFMLCSLHIRNELILSGGDTVLRLMLFWGMFLPLGARYSIDSILNPDGKKLPEGISSVGVLGFFLQTAFVYWFTVIIKLKYHMWRDGTGVLYAFKQAEYTKPLAVWLLNFPGLLEILTYLVVLFEIVGPILLLFPDSKLKVRSVTAVLFILLQVTFGICFELGFFPWSCSVAMLAFLNGDIWDKLFSHKIFKNISNQITNLLSSVKYFAPCSINVQPSRLSNLLAGFFITYILIWNIGTLDPKYLMPKEYSWIGRSLVIGQHWFMFAPPLEYAAWPVFQGRLKDGAFVDLLHNGKPVSFERPKLPSQVYWNQRWQTYILSIVMIPQVLEGNIYHFATYLCNEWNKSHDGDRKLEEIEFYGMFENVVLENKTPEANKKLLWKHGCSDGKL